MIFKRKSPEERFAEDLARALEEEHKRWLESLPPEKRRLVLEREKLMLKNSPAWREAEKRIERGEIKLYWRKIDGDLRIVARDTMKNFPFKRHRDYLLLPSGTEGYMEDHPPISIDWITENAETWRPRALATTKRLEEPIELTGYDGYYEVPYVCEIEARDGRRFLAAAMECLLLEEIDGRKTAKEVIDNVSTRYVEKLLHKYRQLIREGKPAKEEAKNLMDSIPGDALVGLAILKDLGLIV